MAIHNIILGQQFYKSDSEMWPMNKGIPKVEGKVQCSGEAEYVGDVYLPPGGLHAAMLKATQANCELDVVDTSAALVSSIISSIITNYWRISLYS